MRSLIFAVFSTVLLTGSVCAGAEPVPLATGNEWVYREATTGEEFTVRVGTPVVTNDVVYYSLQGYVTERRLVRYNDFGNLVYLDSDSGKEYPLTVFEVVEGGWWQAPGRPCEQEGQTQLRPSQHDGPAGRIAGAVEVRYRSFTCADAGVDSEQYADRIGMLRRVVTTIAGPRTYDLIYARVGSMLIDAARHARFSVSISTTPTSGHWDATLRLQTNGGDILRLPFPTSQRYELRLLDPDGNTIWQWSDGQMFAQAEDSLEVAGEWRTRVQIPKSVLAESGAPAPGWIVQAWMTTTRAPRYAASVPVVADGK